MNERLLRGGGGSATSKQDSPTPNIVIFVEQNRNSGNLLSTDEAVTTYELNVFAWQVLCEFEIVLHYIKRYVPVYFLEPSLSIGNKTIKSSLPTLTPEKDEMQPFKICRYKF